MTTKASGLLRVLQAQALEALNPPTVIAFPYTCKKCGKPANSYSMVKRNSKYGSVYYYHVFRHLNHHKRNGYVSHTVRV